MKANWQTPGIARAWSDAVGNYGDLFQQTLVNPFVLGVARAVKQRKFPPLIDAPGYKRDAWSPESCFAEAIKERRKSWNGTFDAGKLQAWHQSLGAKELDGVHILDLGGGEGYLGRWLSAAGAKGLSVDCSEELQRAGRSKLNNPLVKKGAKKGSAFNDEPFDFDTLSDPPKSLERSIPNLASLTPDLCTCVSVLDHLEHPERLLKSLRLWLGAKPNCLARPLVCVTLSPDFFFGAHQWEMDISKAKQGSAILGPASALDPSHPKTVTVYQRSWMQYERMFTDCGYHVLWCHVTQLNQFPEDLRNRLIQEARLKSSAEAEGIVPASGPFVFWILLPLPNGEPATFSDLEKATKSPHCRAHFDQLNKQQQAQLRNSNIARYQHEARQPVLCAHNLSDGCLVVEEGTVVMSRNGQIKQTFRAGDFIGELESAGDFYVSRFLYPLHAGDDGARTLHLSAAVMATLQTVAQETLPGQLFTTLRDRVATHSWIYHKSSGKGATLFKSKPVISDVTLEHCARAILFCATVEQRTQPETNGLTIVALPEQLVELIRDTTDHHNVGYDVALDWFNAMGIVDAIPGGTPYDHRIKTCLAKAWDDFKTLSASRILFKKEIAKLSKAELDLFRLGHGNPELGYNKEHYDKNQFGKENNKARKLRFAKSFSTELHRLERACGDANIEKALLHRWLGNLALLKCLFFRRDIPVFIHINDMHFLRRIACSADEWQTDLKRRAELSPHVENEKPLSINEQMKDETRLKSYVTRIHNFADAYWKSNRNLGFSTDDHFARHNAVDEFVDFQSRGAG